MGFNNVLSTVGLMAVAAGFAFSVGFQAGIRNEERRAAAAFDATMEAINEVDVPSDPAERRRLLCDLAGITDCPMPGDAP